MRNPNGRRYNNIYKDSRFGTCGACGYRDQPLDSYHVPDLCVHCKRELNNIDYRALQGLRQDMVNAGIPVKGTHSSLYNNIKLPRER